jgi:hypothetical protein
MLMPRPAACLSSSLASNVILEGVIRLYITFSTDFIGKAYVRSKYRRGYTFIQMLEMLKYTPIVQGLNTSSPKVSKLKVQDATYLLALAHELTCGHVPAIACSN